MRHAPVRYPLVDDVLEDLVEGVADVQVSVGVRRPIVEREDVLHTERGGGVAKQQGVPCIAHKVPCTPHEGWVEIGTQKVCVADPYAQVLC